MLRAFASFGQAKLRSGPRALGPERGFRRCRGRCDTRAEGSRVRAGLRRARAGRAPAPWRCQRPQCVRITRTTTGSSISAMTRIGPLHFAHSSGSASWTLRTDRSSEPTARRDRECVYAAAPATRRRPSSGSCASASDASWSAGSPCPRPRRGSSWQARAARARWVRPIRVVLLLQHLLEETFHSGAALLLDEGEHHRDKFGEHARVQIQVLEPACQTGEARELPCPSAQ